MSFSKTELCEIKAFLHLNLCITQLNGALEYTDYYSAEEQDSPKVCPDYNTKQFDSKIPVLLGLLGMRSTLYCYRFQIYFDPDWLQLVGFCLWVKLS